jgi:excisionase family DNA binding protein
MDRSKANNNGGGGRNLHSHTDDIQKLCLTVPEVSKKLGISRNFGYELIKQKQLPFIRLGKRILIPRLALDEMLKKGDL